MNWLRELARRIRMLVNRRQFDVDLEEEMRLHLELRQQDQIESGMSADDAQAAARRRFGNVPSLRERSNMAWGWEWLEHLTQDVRFGFLILNKNLGVTFVLVITLTIGGVSSNYFSALGVKPALGRLVLPGKGEHPGEPAVLVLSYAFWQRRFGGDSQVIGKQVRVGGKPATIVGVMEKEFRGQFSVFEMDAYAPLSTAFDESSASNFWNSRDMHLMLVLGRLRPGVTLAQAQSRFDVVSRRLAAQYAVTDKDLKVRVMDERLSRPIPYANNAFIMFSGLFVILGALVLLLACTNIANILMARASVRQREMAIRAALGGARSRLLRQMLTETMLTALLGGIAGVTLGASLSYLASSTHLSNIPIRLGFGFDWRVFVYALVAVIFTPISAGLSPALRATRADVNTVLHQGGRADAGGKARHKVRGDLMAAQVAGSLTLLIVAGLFVRSLRAVEHMDIGFDPNQLLNVTLDPSLDNYTRIQTNEFYRSLETKVRALPGIQS